MLLVGSPCVAQRVCPIPEFPETGCSCNSTIRLLSLPAFLRISSSESVFIAIPAESYPLYSRVFNPVKIMSTIFRLADAATIPHMNSSKS